MKKLIKDEFQQNSEISRFDLSKYLKTQEDLYAFLIEVFNDKDSTYKEKQKALSEAIKINKGFSVMAKEIGVGRESLYKSLSENTEAKFSTILKVIENLGFDLKLVKKTDKKLSKTA
ncbi:MAG: addiction module antidote protein [Campylobacteraceae bacterium]